MTLTRLTVALLAVVLTVLNTITVSGFSHSRRHEPPRNSTGLTDVVSWDNYTLWLRDQRVFIQ
jgi:hypothetical protein